MATITAPTSATTPATTPAPDGARWALLLVAIPAAIAGSMFVIGAVVQSIVAGEHGQFHALFAAVFLVPALIVAILRPRGGSAATPFLVGFVIAASTQLLEGVGGFGYGPGNEGRVNALANLHDIGVSIAPIGLVGAALGLTLAVGALLRPRFGRWPALALSVVVLAALAVVIAKLIGM